MAWRLKHIPTGLYFKPARHNSKSNLSKKGRIYHKKPTPAICQVEKSYHAPVPGRGAWEYINIPCYPTDWIAEEMK